MDGALNFDKLMIDNKVIGFLVLISLLASCVKDVELEPGSYEPKIVIDGYIESGRGANIYITRSSPFLAEYDSASIRGSFVNNAKVTLSSSSGEKEVLTLFRNDSFFPPFIYRSVSISGEIGREYLIEVELAGKKLRAVTTIPEAPEISDYQFKLESDTTGFPEILITQRRDKAQYFFAMVRSSLENENLHPTLEGVIRVQAGSDAVWYTIQRVRERRMSYEGEHQPYYKSDFPKRQYHIDDEVLVIPGAVDSISYRVILSLFKDLSARDNPFNFNNTGIESNIEGGLGRWTGIARARPIVVSGK
ncbi:MAG TPA: DUF4249 domain-containing protein [Marinilabiliaceae bacterium]|nr:DUF4249 domain-containing protein [Marinilabiliaceae bacterium]